MQTQATPPGSTYTDYYSPQSGTEQECSPRGGYLIPEKMIWVGGNTLKFTVKTLADHWQTGSYDAATWASPCRRHDQEWQRLRER